MKSTILTSILLFTTFACSLAYTAEPVSDIAAEVPIRNVEVYQPEAQVLPDSSDDPELGEEKEVYAMHNRAEDGKEYPEDGQEYPEGDQGYPEDDQGYPEPEDNQDLPEDPEQNEHPEGDEYPDGDEFDDYGYPEDDNYGPEGDDDMWDERQNRWYDWDGHDEL